MRVNGIGCGGLIVTFITIVFIWNIGGCIIGKICDGVREVIAESHAKQEVADARAREYMLRESMNKAFADAKVAEARRVEEAAEERRREKAAAIEREAIKIDKLRTFAMTDAPGIWRAYQQLEAAIAEQDVKIKELAMTLKEFGRNPEVDADYRSVCAARDEMAGSLKDVRCKLEEAYLSYCRFKATPSHKEYAELMQKALDDGARSADEATRKFEQMRRSK